MQSFLVALCIAILDKILVRGTIAFKKYEDLRKELEENDKKSQTYDKVVNSPSTREERRHAEDDLLS
jgi:hypothetical protein